MKGCVGGGQGSKRTVVPLMMMMMMTLKGSFEDSASRKQMLRQSCEGDFKNDVHKWFQPCL
jgi:hypothetical protein